MRGRRKYPQSKQDAPDKRTPTPAAQPEEWRLEASIVSLLTITDDDNRLICPPFRVLPTPEEFPLYYQHIKKPIDLKKIAENIRAGEYSSWHDIEADVQLMCKNAKDFNEPGSTVYKDATRLLQHFNSISTEMTETRRFSQRVISRNKEMINELLQSTPSEINDYSEDSEEDEDSEKSDDPKWKLYWTLRNFDVRGGIPLCENFMELPSKRNYPDYYEEIERPISLYMINKTLKRGQYKDLASLSEELILMFDNACSYNIEGSDIFVAAQRLRKLTMDTTKALEPNFQPPQLPMFNVKNEKVSVEIENSNTVNSTTISLPVAKRKKLSPSPRLSKKEENKQFENEMQLETEDQEQATSSMTTIYSIQKRPRYDKKHRPNSEKHKPGRKSIEELRDKFANTLLQVWQDIVDLKMGDRILSEPFIYLPCDKTFPDYYKTIQKPISMTYIKNKITDSKYNSSDEMLQDIKLMCENARRYNRHGSQISTDSSIIESVASGCMNSRTGGTNLFYPFRRSDKGWTEQSSTEKSPNKHKKKGHSLCENDKNLASTSTNSAIPNLPKSIASDFRPHPVHPGVYIAIIPPQAIVNTNENNHQFGILELANKLKYRDNLSRIQRQMYAILEVILLFRDEDDKYLAQSFIELPSKEEYKDYYQVIKNPIDLSRVVNKLIGQQYDCWRQFVADLRLVFENACKYNEPDSSIYKDAVLLLREITTMREQFFDQLGNHQNYSVQKQLKQILKEMVNSIFDHKDANGKCLCESLTKAYQRLEQHNGASLDAELPFSLEQIQKNVESGLYKRVDRFQEDIFALFSEARRILEPDSEEFDDLVELQRHFIYKRDSFCKNVLLTPASQFTQSLFEEEFTQLRKEKERQTKEKQKINSEILKEADEQMDVVHLSQNGLRVIDDKNPTEGTCKNEKAYREKTPPQDITNQIDTGMKQQNVQTSNIHDLNLYATSDNILDIHREEVLERRQQGIQNLEKPGVAEREINIGFGYEAGLLYYQQIEYNGRFYRLGDGVLVYKEGKPHCEVMRIDKIWKSASGQKMFSGCRFARPTELKHEPSKMFYKNEVIAVMAIDTVEQMDNIQSPCAILTMKQYEQYRPTEIPECDVFIVEQKVLGSPTMDEHGIRIPLTWKNCSVIAARSGQMTVAEDDIYDQREMDLDNARPLRKLRQYNLSREVIEDEIYYFKHPLVMEKILSPRIMNPSSSDHTLPVTHSEIDNEAQFLTSGQRIIGRNIKQQNLAMLSPNDEEGEEGHEHEADIMDIEDEEQLEEYDHDHPSTSSHLLNNNNDLVASTEHYSSQTPTPLYADDRSKQQYTKEENKTEHPTFISPASSSSSMTTPRARNNGNSKGTSWLATQPKLNAKSKSGYILFSAEVRKRVMNENPDAGFGEVSKIVGIEWKRLSDEQKRQYETRAQYIAEERAKAELLTPNSKMPQPGQIRVHCCRWQQCDFQFDSQEGLYEHINTSHTSLLETDYICLWNSCLKYRKETKGGFPSLPRLHRHIKEKHLLSSIRFMFPNQRAKNFFVYLPPQNAQSSTSNSKASNSANNKGRFVHHPYGEVPSNPVPCAFAQSTSTSNNAIQQQGQGPYHPALSSALGQSHVSPPVRYMSPTTGTSKSSSYGSTLMNGTIVPQPSTSNAPMQHYVIQQQQQQYTRQQHQQLGQPIQQQTVVIPAGQQAIVVNGTTVYIPANAHTIILPPGYTGPQQQHQIVVHTQPQVAPHSTMNGPTSAIPNSTQQSHFISASASQQQSQQHQVVIQQNAATSYHSQPPHLVNGMSTPNLHGPASQIIATSNATAQHNTPSIPGSRHQQMLNQQQLLTTTQSIQQQPFVSGTAAFNQGAPSTQSQPQHQSTANAVPQVPNYIDPGRTVVTVSKPPEPVFVAPSSSVHVKRVVHSEAYVRYIESMYNSPGRQQMVKKWDKALQASHKNTLVPNHRRLPYEWVTKVADGSKPKEEEIVRALWQLRNQLVEDTTGINMSDSRSNVEAIPPQPPGFEVDGKSNGNGGDKKKGGC